MIPKCRVSGSQCNEVGGTAVAKYPSWRPHVVLIDRNMPQMDGITCAKLLFDLDPNVRIILISGYDMEGPNGIDGETRALIRAYLTKPIDVMELSRVLNTMLADGRD